MNGHVPDLGAYANGQQQKVPIQIVGVLIRDLDKDGLYTPEQVQMTPNGPMVVTGRQNIVTAEDLVEMFREMVREELANAVSYLLKHAETGKK